MVVVVLALLGAVLAARLTGGRFNRLGDLPLHAPWLVIAAVAAQLAGALLGDAATYAGCLATSAVLGGLFLALNRGVAGLGLVALGFAANAVAVTVNGGQMPVSLSALARVDASTGELLRDPRHEPASSSTRIRLLTDVIPAPLPGAFGQVLSPGDVAVASGCALLVFAGMRRSRHGEKGPQATGTQEQQGQPREAPERLRAPAWDG